MAEFKDVMKLDEEQKQQTNADKFNEVFTPILIDDICIGIPCDGRCSVCKLYQFEEQEYKEPKGCGFE